MGYLRPSEPVIWGKLNLPSWMLMGHIWVDENGKLSMEKKITQDKHTQDLDIFYFTDLDTSAIIHENHLHKLHHLWWGRTVRSKKILTQIFAPKMMWGCAWAPEHGGFSPTSMVIFSGKRVIHWFLAAAITNRKVIWESRLYWRWIPTKTTHKTKQMSTAILTQLQ